MIDVHINDIFILKATNSPGFICGSGQLVYFKSKNGDKYFCGLGSEYPSDATFPIEFRNISKIIDSISNEIIYQHDPNDAL